MVDKYNTEGFFGEIVELDEVDHRHYSGKDYVATDDLEDDGNRREMNVQGLLKMLGRGTYWSHQKPQLTASGTDGSRNLSTDAGSYYGYNGSYDYVVAFNEGTPGFDDIPFDDDSSSDYYVECLPAEVPVDVSVGRDGVLRYSRWKRVVGFSGYTAGTGDNNDNLKLNAGGIDAITTPTSTTMKFDITTKVGGAWASIGAGARTRPVVIWKQSAGEQDDNRGAVSQDPNVAIYEGVAESDGVNVTVSVPHTFGQGTSPSTTTSDYTVVVLGPWVNPTRKFSFASLIFARFNASTGDVAYDDAYTAPTQATFAGIWTAVDMKPVGGNVVWDPSSLAQWAFKSNAGYVWQTDQDSMLLILSFSPWPLGKVHIRKIRIRASSDTPGDYVEVTVFRRDNNGTNLSMDTGAPRQFDSVTTELTIVPDAATTLVVNEGATGADSQYVMFHIESSGSPGTVFELAGIDVFWELCDE